MGRAPCCEKDSVKRGPWTPEEDAKLLACISQHGTGNWRTLPKKAGLQRCGKSCRLRWTNYLRPDLKHGRFTEHEEHLIVKLHAALGSRWSLIAAQLPGRTDNDVKNYWNTRLKKKLCEMGIDPITHKPISQLLADLATSIALPSCPSLTVDNSHHVNGGQGSGGGGGGIAEATLGYFKDDMLNVLLTRKNKPPTNYNNNPSLGLHHVTLPCLPSTPPPPPLFDAFFQPHVPPRGPVGGIRSQAAIMAARGKATVVTSDHTPSYFQQLGALPDTLLMQQGGFDLGTFSSIFPEDHQLYASLLQQQQHQYHQHQHQNQHHYQHQQQVEINDIVVSLPMHNILMESNKNNDYPTIESMTWSPSSSTSCTSLPPPASDIGPNNSTDALLLDFSDLDHMMSSSNEQPTRNR